MGNKRSRNFVALEPEAESPGLHQRGGCHENQELSTAGLTEDSRSPSTARRRAATMGKQGMRSNKMLVFMCINLTNLCCHSVYSVLAAFFPQEAEKKGLSEDAVGIVFASFAAVIFLCSLMAGGWMTHYGKDWVYITGIILVSVSTILFAGATTMPDGSLFGSYCLIMRLLQGVGSNGGDGGVRDHRRPRPGEHLLLSRHHRDLDGPGLHGRPGARRLALLHRWLHHALPRARHAAPPLRRHHLLPRAPRDVPREQGGGRQGRGHPPRSHAQPAGDDHRHRLDARQLGLRIPRADARRPRHGQQGGDHP